MSAKATPAFDGFLRGDGRVGIRNYVVILSITGLTGPAARTAQKLTPLAKVVSLPYSTGLVNRDRDVHDRVIRGIIGHPNVFATVMLADNAKKLQAYAAFAVEGGYRNTALLFDDFDQDNLLAAAAAARRAAELLVEASRERRRRATFADLAIGLKCGRSDPSSGLVANPLAGRLCDRIVESGGRAIAGETFEWIGAEHLLAEQADSAELAGRIRDLVNDRERRAADAHIDVNANNPSPTNIRSGITSIEEKALGGVTKIGTTPIRGLLDYGEPPASRGLFLMDSCSFAPEHLTGLAAAGCQLMLFTTGQGNPYVSTLAPTLKLSANARTVERTPHHIDFDASSGLEGVSLDELAASLEDRFLEIASGALTCGEALDTGEEVVSRFEMAL